MINENLSIAFIKCENLNVCRIVALHAYTYSFYNQDTAAQPKSFRDPEVGRDAPVEDRCYTAFLKEGLGV